MKYVFLQALTVISFWIINSSCSSEAPAKEIKQLHIVNSDSIDAIRRALHIEEKAKKLDAVFKAKVKKENFNGCVLIAQSNQIIYEASYGFANIEKKEPLSINSAFQLSSTSKTFTAAAILQLVEQKKINLDQDIKTIFPLFPYSGISIQMLLSHRSGLSNYIYDCEMYCEKPNLYNGSPFDNNAMLEIICKHQPAKHAPPNKKFEYCNTNYALLALVVEKVSGMRFNEYLNLHIFQPLGMNHTWVNACQQNDTIKTKTFGHYATGRINKECYADDVCGDKGIYSTVEDMFKWDQALYSEKILKSETLNEAFKGYSNEHRGQRNYGLGWRIIEDKKTKIVYHNGWWHGYNSTFYRMIDDQTTIIILSNKDNRSAYRITEIVEALNSKNIGELEF